MTLTVNIGKPDIVRKLAEDLKKSSNIQAPEWAQFVKTGAGRERPPVNGDWWFQRAASILVAVADLGPVGVNKLRVKYGNKKNRGFKPEKFYKGSGNIIRKILQQLEADKMIEKGDKGVHKGRVVSKQGLAMINKYAAEKKAEKAPKAVEQPKEPAKEAPKAEKKKKAPAKEESKK